MEFIIIMLLMVLAFLILKAYLRKSSSESSKSIAIPASKYAYKKRQYIMSKAENDFYKVLQNAIGSGYMIYPQAHLDLFLDHKIKGQSYAGALSTIQRKSVDFLVCSREYYNPLVAIELDDASHNKQDRIDRDAIVDGICEQAGMPIVRIEWKYTYDTEEILRTLAPFLK